MQQPPQQPGPYPPPPGSYPPYQPPPPSYYPPPYGPPMQTTSRVYKSQQQYQADAQQFVAHGWTVSNMATRERGVNGGALAAVAGTTVILSTCAACAFWPAALLTLIGGGVIFVLMAINGGGTEIHVTYTRPQPVLLPPQPSYTRPLPPSQPITTPPQPAPRQQFSKLWWVLDKRDLYGCCIDCQHLAARSPYDPPGSGGNELHQTPGDGQTECGAACTCFPSYDPPERAQPDPLTPDQEYWYRLPPPQRAEYLDR